ncbi:hypothetical protein G7046_g1318 [Stylonectria norvegica]|nr:hypothetical protein G7046_g1318 [Stylonectria norvegica]
MLVNKNNLEDGSRRLTAAIKDFTSTTTIGSGDETANRMAIVKAAQDVLQETTLPQEQWVEQASVMGSMTAARLFLKWNAFDEIPIGGTISYGDLAEKLDADASLIRRVGGMLVAGRVLQQVGEDELRHTPKSLIYTNSSPYSFLFRMVFDETLIPYVFMPKYFDEYHRREPQGPTHNPYSFANGQPDKPFWDIMNQDPERMRAFMQAMKAAEAMMPVMGVYSYEWLRDEMESNTERVLLVDVGGGKGHAVQGICKENPWLTKERCVVQDREDVIREAKALDVAELRGVKMMGHDFNLEQPIKGALVYHLRRCLHDYGDSICVQMLQRLADAMAQDSRLVIIEQVVGNPPSQMAAHFDFVMLSIGGKERTAKDFERLTKEAGLRVLKIHERAGVPVAAVECVKA